MIPTTLISFVTILAALATANGAVFQRQGTFTFLSPQPTLGGTTSSTPVTSPTSSVPTSSTVSSSSNTTSSKPTSASSTVSVPVTPSTNSSVPVTPSTTSSVPTTTSSTVSVPVTPPITNSSVPVTKPTVTATPTSTTPVPPTQTSGTANCDGVQDWLPAFAYSAGNRVIFNGQLFTAKQWTYNNAPPAHPDQWTPGGTCSQPVHNTVDCHGISAWQNNVAYTAGNQVTFQNRLWSAVQWTFNNSPGDSSGSWQNLGVCASMMLGI